MTSVLKTPIHIRSMVDTVMERLEHAIMSGELPAGSRLSEQALADDFGVSRGPLREAIRRLEGRKLVERIPFIGARVLALSPKDILDIFIVREALEGMAARLVAENASDEELKALRAVVSPHVGSACLDVDSYQRSPDLDFHYQIAIRSGNQKLIEYLCNDVYYLLRVFRYQSTQQPGRLAQGLGEHEAIIGAIEVRDPDGAEALMRLHLRNGRRSLLQMFESEALPFDAADSSLFSQPDGALPKKQADGARVSRPRRPAEKQATPSDPEHQALSVAIPFSETPKGSEDSDGQSFSS